MATAAFVELANGLVTAMGQRLDAARPIPEGLAVRTGDGFLYAFFEDPNEVSLASVRRLLPDAEAPSVHLVVFSPGHLPLAITADVARRGGTVVEGSRFHELARQLGLAVFLGEEPRAAVEHPRRLLPTAQQLDAVTGRARTWLEWGVPALALRFYRQAAALKPEYAPAKVGIGRSLLGLGLVTDAEKTFREVLASHPDDVDARLGMAAALGARAKPKEEIELYRTLLAEDQARLEVRAHLLAALVDIGDWSGARVEIEALLGSTPEDPQLRFLRGVALERTGAPAQGAAERAEARRLGLPYDREVALCAHLGLPSPPPPLVSAPPAPDTPVGSPPRRARAHRLPPRRTRTSKPSPATKPARPGRKRK
jgi:tetratricopeptide (TPR) repeat protein